MRVNRKEKFKKIRKKKIRQVVVYTLILPFSSIFVGYIITTVFILPSIGK